MPRHYCLQHTFCEANTNSRWLVLSEKPPPPPNTAEKYSHFLVPSRDVTDQTLSGRGKTKLFPPRKSLVSDIPPGDGKTANPLLQWTLPFRDIVFLTFFTQCCIPLLRCNENPLDVFPGKELCELSPNFHIKLSLRDLYIPSIGPHIFLQQKRQTNRGNI